MRRDVDATPEASSAKSPCGIEIAGCAIRIVTSPKRGSSSTATRVARCLGVGRPLPAEHRAHRFGEARRRARPRPSRSSRSGARRSAPRVHVPFAASAATSASRTSVADIDDVARARAGSRPSPVERDQRALAALGGGEHERRRAVVGLRSREHELEDLRRHARRGHAGLEPQRRARREQLAQHVAHRGLGDAGARGRASRPRRSRSGSSTPAAARNRFIAPLQFSTWPHVVAVSTPTGNRSSAACVRPCIRASASVSWCIARTASASALGRCARGSPPSPRSRRCSSSATAASSLSVSIAWSCASVKPRGRRAR